jgi:hypothetical protein
VEAALAEPRCFPLKKEIAPPHPTQKPPYYLGPLGPRTRTACALSNHNGTTYQNTVLCALTRRTECAMVQVWFLQA